MGVCGWHFYKHMRFNVLAWFGYLGYGIRNVPSLLNMLIVRYIHTISSTGYSRNLTSNYSSVLCNSLLEHLLAIDHPSLCSSLYLFCCICFIFVFLPLYFKLMVII